SIRKGIVYLLEAFARFDHPRKRLNVIGMVEPGIERLLRLHLSDSVAMVGPGRVPTADLARYYSEADGLVLPSIEDGFGFVMAEAMSCGCPVIATVNTGAEHLFEHGKEGLIVPIRSIESMVEALDTLAQSGKRVARQMRSAVRARIEEFGGWDTYGDRWAM